MTSMHTMPIPIPILLSIPIANTYRIAIRKAKDVLVDTGSRKQ